MKLKNYSDQKYLHEVYHTQVLYLWLMLAFCCSWLLKNYGEFLKKCCGVGSEDT